MNSLAEWLRRRCAIGVLIFFAAENSLTASELDGPPKIFYGGFAFAGNAGEIAKNYPIASKLDALDGGNGHFFETQSREFFVKHAGQFRNVSVTFDLVRPHDSPLVLALALSSEKILHEELSDFHKLVIQLGFELLILDFDTMEVVSSRPICIEYIDAGKNEFSEDEVVARMRTMIAGANSQLFVAILSKIGSVRIGGKNQCTLQIHAVSIGDKSVPFLPDAYRNAKATYAQAVAQQFGALLTSQGGLAMLPYSKDGLNSKMALRFSDSSVLQFKIPPPTFAMDVDVRGFKKVLSKKTDAESLWIYGAFLNVRVYEPEFNVVFFDAPIKYGVSKIVPASQMNVDEFPVISEALTGAFLSTIDEMRKNQSANEKVLQKCQL
jgi:hypothetical protein